MNWEPFYSLSFKIQYIVYVPGNSVCDWSLAISGSFIWVHSRRAFMVLPITHRTDEHRLYIEVESRLIIIILLFSFTFIKKP